MLKFQRNQKLVSKTALVNLTLYTGQYSKKYGSFLSFLQTCNFPYGRQICVFDEKP